MSRRDAGFTLIELKVVIVVGALLYGVGAAFAVGVKRADRFSAAYTQDLSGLRKAVTQLERDLRGAQTVAVGTGTATIDETVYRLEESRLLRAGQLLAGNIERFELSREGDRVRVLLRLGARNDAPQRREPEIVSHVRLRNAGGGR
jgi:hypothetical protein